MKTVYAICKPVLGYDDSHEVYFTCTTKAVAEACADRMNHYLMALKNRLPDLPGFTPEPELPDDHPEWVAYNEIDDRFEAMRNRARWPYGIDLFHWREHVNPIQVMPLKLREKP
jgi:hypothetical protein